MQPSHVARPPRRPARPPAQSSLLCGFDFVVAPLAHPRYRRPAPTALPKGTFQPPFTRSDLLLTSGQWSGQVRRVAGGVRAADHQLTAAAQWWWQRRRVAAARAPWPQPFACSPPLALPGRLWARSAAGSTPTQPTRRCGRTARRRCSRSWPGRPTSRCRSGPGGGAEGVAGASQPPEARLPLASAAAGVPPVVLRNTLHGQHVPTPSHALSAGRAADHAAPAAQLGQLCSHRQPGEADARAGGRAGGRACGWVGALCVCSVSCGISTLLLVGGQAGGRTVYIAAWRVSFHPFACSLC